MKRLFLMVMSMVFLATAAWAASETEAKSVAGTWQISWEGRQGTLELQQDGSKLTGTFKGERGSVPVSGSLKDNKISFDTTIQGERRSVKIAFTGTVDGDKMSGTVKPEGGFGMRRRGGNQSHSWSATRQSDESTTAGGDSKASDSDDSK